MLLFKHAIVELGIQAQLQNIDKTNYLGNGHLHYLHHGIGTLVVAGLFLPANLAVCCALFDYIIHWHIDYLKTKINKVLDIENRTPTWWWTNVIDQCLHFSTYYFMAIYFSAMSFLIFL